MISTCLFDYKYFYDIKCHMWYKVKKVSQHAEGIVIKHVYEAI